MNKNGGNRGTVSSTRYKVLTGIVALLLIPLAMSQPKTPPTTPKPSFETRHPRIWALGQIVMWFTVTAGLAFLFVWSTKNADGWDLALTNTAGALLVAIGGTLQIAGASRNLPGATSVSWGCVALGGWIVAMGSSEFFWDLLPVSDAREPEPPIPCPLRSLCLTP